MLPCCHVAMAEPGAQPSFITCQPTWQPTLRMRRLSFVFLSVSLVQSRSPPVRLLCVTCSHPDLHWDSNPVLKSEAELKLRKLNLFRLNPLSLGFYWTRCEWVNPNYQPGFSVLTFCSDCWHAAFRPSGSCNVAITTTYANSLTSQLFHKSDESFFSDQSLKLVLI